MKQQDPVAYRGIERVEADIENLRSAAGGRPAFMSAASPGVRVAMRLAG